MHLVPVFLISIFWNFFIFLPPRPLYPPYFWTGLVIFCILVIHLFLNLRLHFDLTKTSIAFVGCALGILLIALMPFLNFSLAGDELYHAMVSNPILMKLEGKNSYQDPDLNEWTQYLDSISQSYRRFFSSRHLPVQEVWRMKSLPWIAVLLTFLFWVTKFKYFSTRTQKLSCYLFLGLSILVGHFLGLGPEIHPPLRNLPAFIFQVFIGLTPLAFKLPQVFAAALFAFYWHQRFIKILPRGEILNFWGVLGAALSLGVPVVFYSLFTYEPSIWAFFIASAVLIESYYLLKKDFASSKDTVFIVAFLLGVGSLMRHTLVLYWFPFALALIFKVKEIGIKTIIMAFIPSLLPLPFILGAFLSGYTGALSHAPFTESLKVGIDRGLMVIPLVYNLGALGVFLFFSALLASGFYFLKFKDRGFLLVLTFVFVYFLYLSKLDVGMWAVGRYQAEYFAPFISLLVFQSFFYINRAKFPGANSIKIIAAIFSFAFIVQAQGIVYSLSTETNYKNLYQMRVSSSSYLPYQPALEYLKASEAAGNFLILGGEPWYGSMPLWLAGHSLADSNRWATIQSRFMKLPELNIAVFEEFLHQEKVRYILIQEGTKRQRQHRSPDLNELILELENNLNIQNIRLIKDKTYGPQMGGYLSVYRVVDLTRRE